MSFSLLCMRIPFCRLFEKSTVNCCFYVDCSGEIQTKQRSSLAFGLSSVFTLQIFHSTEFSIFQKAAFEFWHWIGSTYLFCFLPTSNLEHNQVSKWKCTSGGRALPPSKNKTFFYHQIFKWEELYNKFDEIITGKCISISC